LEAYSYVEHQLPERRFEEGEYLCVKGEPCEEAFLITSGECIVEEGEEDDETVNVSRFRRASNLVGEIDPDAEIYSVSVKAKENTRALVFTRDDIKWANTRDYRLTQAFNDVIRERRRIVARYEAKLRSITKQKERAEIRHQSEFVRR
jgi:CRP-like cAMP-binding protein